MIAYKIYKKIWIVLKNLNRLIITFFKFIKIKDNRFRISAKDIRPCLFENTEETNFDRHYIYHTAWAARKLVEIKPEKLHDFSSSLYFIGIVSSFLPIVFHDFRPANIQLSNVDSLSGDLTLLNIESNSLKCVSCMHVVEHIGLGRYGDELDEGGDLKAISELRRITAISGDLLFVVPVGGIPFIRFNANRVYDYQQIISLFPDFELIEFTFITDYGNKTHVIKNATSLQIDSEVEGCGCFHFKKSII